MEALSTQELSARSPTIGEVVDLIQDYTKKWPEPCGYPSNAHFAATDTDRGFERILRETLQNALPIGHVSSIRDLGMGDGRTPAIVPLHELDVIVLCQEGRFVVEAKAWDREVGKEEVFIFLAKTFDFLAARNADALGPIFTGFIGLRGFTDAAMRVMFALGVLPFTQNANQLSFRFIDALLARLMRSCQQQGKDEPARALSEQRAALTPFLNQERKGLSRTFQFDADAAVVDLDGIRRASEMFDEGRTAHRHAMACYREVRKAIEVDRA